MALGRLPIFDIKVNEYVLARPGGNEFLQISQLQNQSYGIDIGTIEYCWGQGLAPQGAGRTFAGFCS
jgi:hypothetical protein